MARAHIVGAMADTFASLVETFKNVGVSKAYGAPVQLGGEEVIPVALVSFGFGGGGEAGQVGASGGGVGVYRCIRGRVVFRPNTVVALACLVPVISVLGSAVGKAIRAAR